MREQNISREHLEKGEYVDTGLQVNRPRSETTLKEKSMTQCMEFLGLSWLNPSYYKAMLGSWLVLRPGIFERLSKLS